MADLVVEDGTGLTNSNSYATVDEADLYHENRLHVLSWTSAEESDKEIALVWATSFLDENLIWTGYKYDEDQALEWPRNGAADRAGYAIDVDEIPQFLKDAVSEFARNLIAEDRTAENDTKGFSRIRVSVIELYISKHDRKTIIPESVWSIVQFCAEKRRSKARELVRM